MKRLLRTFENNSMSLSCKGEMVIENNIIQSINWHGYPRADGKDSWVNYYDNLKIGDTISQDTIDKILNYNGYSNIICEISII